MVELEHTNKFKKTAVKFKPSTRPPMMFNPDHIRPSMMIDVAGPTDEELAEIEKNYKPAELTNRALYAALNDFEIYD